MCQILKRDGRETTFDKTKIHDAVLKSFISVEGEPTAEGERISSNISEIIKLKIENLTEILSVERIQNMVEDELYRSGREDVYEAYKSYRDERNFHRERNSKLLVDTMKKLAATNIENQNANMDEHSFGGRMGEARNVVTKQCALDFCMTEREKFNHENNRIYTHDLDSYAVGMGNCLSIPYDPLLKDGFNTRQTDIRGARSINTAFQLVAVIAQLQSLQQFGGVSATHLDWTMVPYVRISFGKHYRDGKKYIEEEKFDITTLDLRELSIEDDSVYDLHSKAYTYAMDKTLEELNQAVEGMYHNLNTLQSRSGWDHNF